jgi:predicted nucleotidyltransferase
MDASIEENLGRVAAACRRYGVERLDLFGSALGQAFDPESSDLDFVVAFAPTSPPRLFDRYFGLKEELESVFGRDVDLVMEGALAKSPPFAQGVAESRRRLYAA